MNGIVTKISVFLCMCCPPPLLYKVKNHVIMILFNISHLFIIFAEWLQVRNKSLDFESWNEEYLGETLATFYAELRTKEGKSYSRSSLLCIRAAIQRHIALPPHNVTFNIITGAPFKKANNVLIGRIKDLKREGLDVSKSHPAISANDISMLYSSGTLSHVTPSNLQYKVFFELGMHFGRRGREGLRELKHSQIVFKEDSEGKNYATLSFNPLEKTLPRFRCVRC